jgi:hypothetical protein
MPTERRRSSEIEIAAPSGQVHSFLARSETPKACPTSTSLKENAMNEATELELEIVELGDAKEETKGADDLSAHETNPDHPYRP